MESAKAFENLLRYQYHFTLGRKGITTDIVLGFDKQDFHHLIGLHKLRDYDVSRANREQVFDDILSGDITYDHISGSTFFDESQKRLNVFSQIESLIDTSKLIFKYNNRNNPGSQIEAEFFMKLLDNARQRISFLFIDTRQEGIFYCRSFFPFEFIDFSKNQRPYSILFQEKITVATGEHLVQMDRKQHASPSIIKTLNQNRQSAQKNPQDLHKRNPTRYFDER